MEIVRFVKTEDIAERINTLFEAEKQKLSEVFPDATIEHIGGTSVRGSVSKGDLDINIRVKAADFDATSESLKKLYQINQPDNWTLAFASFKDDGRDLGIQLTVYGSPEDHFVTQRDYLKSHPEKLTELNSLKQSFEGQSMDDYRKKKGAFFEELF